jgi:predicted phosphoribosyltransferase
MRAFIDRRQAGRALAERLKEYAGRPDVVVLALPRGGVPVAHEVARALHVPLDVIIVRKLGLPGHPELAMGAIAGGKVGVLNRQLMRAMRVEDADFDRVLSAERAELARREREYRGARPPLDLKGRTVILVDDGLATGATMAAAVGAVTQQHPAKIVVAVPVASREAVAQLKHAGADVVTVATPEPFYGVGNWYEDFNATSDAEVKTLLAS